MLFTIKKFKETDVCEKKWPNDFRIDCKPSSNLVELIKKDLDFFKLEKLEGFFE
jgi:hypothetical protein